MLLPPELLQPLDWAFVLAAVPAHPCTPQLGSTDLHAASSRSNVISQYGIACCIAEQIGPAMAADYIRGCSLTLPAIVPHYSFEKPTSRGCNTETPAPLRSPH